MLVEEVEWGEAVDVEVCYVYNKSVGLWVVYV